MLERTLKSKLLKISDCWIRKSPPYMNKHSLLSLIALTYISILTTEILHGEVQSGQTFKKYTLKETRSPNCI